MFKIGDIIEININCFSVGFRIVTDVNEHYVESFNFVSSCYRYTHEMYYTLISKGFRE
jgi:hypothetical protein